MPNQYYCQNCGSGTNCSASLPKFCGACGFSFEGSVTKTQPQKVQTSRAARPMMVQPEEVYEQIPHLDKLEIVVKGNPRNRQGEKLKNLIGNQEYVRVSPINFKQKRPKINPKEFMLDAKSDRTPIEIGE